MTRSLATLSMLHFEMSRHASNRVTPTWSTAAAASVAIPSPHRARSTSQPISMTSARSQAALVRA
jgi:hypothetical protein